MKKILLSLLVLTLIAILIMGIFFITNGSSNLPVDRGVFV